MDSGIPSLAPSLPSGEVQAFYDDLNGKQYINEVYKFSVDKLYDLLFTESQFMRDFLQLRRFSGERILIYSATSTCMRTPNPRSVLHVSFVIALGLPP